MKTIAVKVSLLVFVILNSSVVAQINTPAGATKPFGSNTSYAFGIMPTNLPSSGTYGKSSDAATAYNQWKTNYVRDCGTSKRVLFDDNSSTVSEGIAYGMLLAAYAADKTTFDGLWKYYKDNSNSNGVMNWKINGCTGASGYNGATDAELDAAMALIIAEQQWPSATSPYDYNTEANTLIGKIRQYEIHPNSHQTINGDAWGFSNSCRNPSYFSPAYYREFAKVESSQASFWNSTVSASNSFLLSNRNSSTGLVSNWADPSAAANACNGPSEYGWDACRNPWRMATDYIWNGSSAATTAADICAKIAAWSNGNANNLKGPLPTNASSPSQGSYKAGAFSTYATAVMGSSATYQNHLNSCYTAVVALGNSESYFNSTLRALTLFTLTGNFWKPGSTGGGGGGSSNQAPTVQLTSPTNNSNFCEGSSITISASANDADGSIAKVEFYDGSTLLNSDNSAPYTYTWSNPSNGNHSISAKAYDNANASTSSASSAVTVNA
ncbi:MAG: glycosyl hydrolase family 8, partial [Bacteroidetes bacterium]|nr:glycosyl hydrolase family 8 [Bacteroidota bacterium]